MPMPGGRPAAAALVLAVMAGPTAAGTLTAVTDAGTEIARLDVPEGAGWCVLWNHSVKGFEVADCYVNDGGRMVLKRSHLPDFAAGLDHIPGRGEQVSDGRGGYWIEAIDEAVPGNAYLLRVGSPAVDHRLAAGDEIISLSERAAGVRVTLRLAPGDPP